MFKNLFVVLQKIGKSLMLPVSVLPIAYQRAHPLEGTFCSKETP